MNHPVAGEPVAGGPLAIMALQVAALYRCTPAGRLLAVNEPGPEAEQPLAPRFFMGRTPAGHHWRFRHDLPAELMIALERLCQAEPLPASLLAPPRQRAPIMRLLAEHAPIQTEYRGPAFWIPQGIAVPDHVVLVGKDNQALLAANFAWLLPLTSAEQRGPLSATVVDGQAVAVCFCARLTTQAAEAGLETAAAYRGHGYGGAAVAGWAAAIRASGRLPLYSTWWENLASRRVAEKLGLVLYGEDWSLV
jgi:RimJ/RimL family protein N-acetyltransferase